MSSINADTPQTWQLLTGDKSIIFWLQSDSSLIKTLSNSFVYERRTRKQDSLSQLIEGTEPFACSANGETSNKKNTSLPKAS